jgi:Leucine-rich repeat (LRR) protein
LTKLKKLELENNQIESISDQTLATLTELTSLSVGNNKIKKFACSKNLDKLTLLNLNFNQLTSFPKIKGKKLSTIMWEGNVFTDLSELQNCELPALESIDLQYCDFSKSGLPKLNLPGL